MKELYITLTNPWAEEQPKLYTEKQILDMVSDINGIKSKIYNRAVDLLHLMFIKNETWGYYQNIQSELSFIYFSKSK